MSAVIDEEIGLLCPNCGEVKPRSEWRPSDLNGRPGTRGWCRDCNNAYEKNWRETRPVEDRKRDRKARSDRERVRSSRIRAEDPKAYGDKMRLWNYKMTPERYDAMVLAQQGICANPACEQALSHVDHDHSCCPTFRNKAKTCGECVRGLLCRECNLALGIMADSIERLEGLVAYLQMGR